MGEGGVSGGNVREDSAKNKTKIGRVFLVGAGCGRADLITLRGLNLLKDCDAVVYDDLIDRELLMAVPGDGRVLLHGKAPGKAWGVPGGNLRSLNPPGQRGKKGGPPKGRRPLCVWPRRGRR